jgi:hypothetical protein
MALTLARIVDEGSPEGRPGGSGLTLFFARVRKEDGLLNGISINRLKDKLGTRDVPTAELLLKDMIAEPVCGLGNGIKNISPMLTITRTWNAVCAAADLRRATDLAIDYANKRVAFGAPLSQKPLHRQTLATLEAESRAAMLLALRTAELLGIEETSTTASDELRLLTPLAKLGTGKQAIWGVSEAIESFGGAGYVEDTGLPRMLRDAQVYPIWEGTTNVLALDALRALGASDACLVALMNHARMCVQHAPEELARAVTSVLDGATAWLSDSEQKGREFLEAGARAFSLSLVRAYALALLLGEATRAEGAGGDTAGWGAAARVFARTRIDYFGTVADPGDAAELLDGQKATTYAGPR